MTDLEQIRLWEKEEAEARQIARGFAKCELCANRKKTGCIFKTVVSITAPSGRIKYFPYLSKELGRWRRCDKFNYIKSEENVNQ